jgi:hypothetical protein
VFVATLWQMLELDLVFFSYCNDRSNIYRSVNVSFILLSFPRNADEFSKIWPQQMVTKRSKFKWNQSNCCNYCVYVCHILMTYRQCYRLNIDYVLSHKDTILNRAIASLKYYQCNCKYCWSFVIACIEKFLFWTNKIDDLKLNLTYF